METRGANKQPVRLQWRFEQALDICPPIHKLQLFNRYIRWVEETYPSLGAASELRNILYRCVKETCTLEGVNNHPFYVDAWLKLVDYCDAPTELFNLLFHHGVGTLNAKFYIAWTEHIQHLPEKSSSSPLEKWARLATIFAHGLQAGAQPIVLLEDRAECLLDVVRHNERLVEEEQNFHKMCSARRNATQLTSDSSDERKTLASLRIVEPVGGESGGPSIIPSVRIGHALNPEQRGLRHLLVESQEPSRQPQKALAGLQIYRDTNTSNDLPNLSVIQSGSDSFGTALSRLTEPMPSWNVENIKPPITRLDRTTALSEAPTSASESLTTCQPPSLTIYKDSPEEASRTNKMSLKAPPMTSTRSRGLRAVRSQNRRRQQHRNSLLFSFECLKSALPAEQTWERKEATEKTEDTRVNVEFFCDVNALYSMQEETCFEMNRMVNYTQPAAGVEYSFSGNLDDPHSKALMQEIKEIISGHYSEEESASEAESQARRDYSNLIGKLNAIIAKAASSEHRKKLT